MWFAQGARYVMRKTFEGKEEMEEDEEHNASLKASLPTWPAALVPVLVDWPQLDAFHFHTRPRLVPTLSSHPRRHHRPTSTTAPTVFPRGPLLILSNAINARAI